MSDSFAMCYEAVASHCVTLPETLTCLISTIDMWEEIDTVFVLFSKVHDMNTRISCTDAGIPDSTACM